MAFSQRLEIRQGHALVMTPQLMQAIKLLQLSNLDLAAYVDKEVESNPLLERAEGADTEIRGTESHAGPASAANEGSEGPARDTSGVALVRGEKSIDGESAADADAAV